MIKNIFKYALLCIAVLIKIMLLTPSPSLAQTISIVLQDVSSSDYTAWSLASPVALNTATTMSSLNGINVIISSKPRIDLSAAVTTSGAWTAGSVPGLNVYKLELKAFSDAQSTPNLAAGATIVSATATKFDLNIKDQSRWVYAKVTTPTATTSGKPQLLTVTITATVH